MIVGGLESGRLLSLKLRWPLFEKRSNSFIAIIGQVATNLLAHLVVERLRKFLLLARKKRLLYRADGERRPLRDFLRQRFHSRFELGGRNDLIYQAERKRRFRIDHVTRVKKFGSFGWSNKLRQEISSAVIGKQSNLCEILSEGRFFRGNANVRSERNVHARTGGSAVHGGNHRLRHGAHLEDHLHAGAQQRLQLMYRASLAALPHRAKVAARAQSAPRAGDHNDSDGVIPRAAPQRLVNRRG